MNNTATTTNKKGGCKTFAGARVSGAIVLLFVMGFNCAGVMPCAAQQSYLVPPPPVSSNDTIPPEVVPLTTPPADSAFGANAPTPGLTSPELTGAGPNNALNGMQTAQQGRQAAFNSLMGNQQWTPQLNEELQAQAAAKAHTTAVAQGTTAVPAGMSNVPGMSNMPAAAPGMSPENTTTPGNAAPQVAMQSAQGDDYSESQTLTGGVKYQQNYQSTQRSGVTNATSSGLGLVSGYANPSNISTLGAASGLGLGFFLLGATGLGIRNGFRW